MQALHASASPAGQAAASMQQATQPARTPQIADTAQSAPDQQLNPPRSAPASQAAAGAVENHMPTNSAPRRPSSALEAEGLETPFSQAGPGQSSWTRTEPGQHGLPAQPEADGLADTALREPVPTWVRAFEGCSVQCSTSVRCSS